MVSRFSRVALLSILAACSCETEQSGPNFDAGNDTLSDAGQDVFGVDTVRFDTPRPDSGFGGGDLRGEVEVIITADNAYAFGWGGSTTLLNYFGEGVGINTLARQIASCPIGGPDGTGADRASSGPERYVISESDSARGEFLYVVAWADSSTAQGLIAQFKRTDGRGRTIYSGDPAWEVCATGDDYDSGETPPQTSVETELAKCNAGTSPSGGWVNRSGAVTSGALGKVELGALNDGSALYGAACQSTPEFAPGFDDEAQWVWYNWDPSDPNLDVFDGTGGNPWNDFLIFRMPLQTVLTPLL